MFLTVDELKQKRGGRRKRERESNLRKGRISILADLRIHNLLRQHDQEESKGRLAYVNVLTCP